MKQMYIIDSSDPGSDYGIGTYMRQLSDCLDKEYVQIHRIRYDSQKRTFGINRTGDMPCFYLPSLPAGAVSGASYPAYRSLSLYLLIPYIDDSSDTVFLLNYEEGAGFVDSLRKHWPRARVIYVVHFLDKQEELGPESIRFYRSVDRIVCLSADTRKFLLREADGLSPEAVRLIPNAAADRYRPSPEAEREALRRKLYLEPDDRVLLYVGRIDMFKGLAEILHAFRLLLAENPACRLILAGAGAVEHYLALCDGLWSRISFTGKLAPERLADLYRIADLGILASWHEQSSYVAIEMMMHGVPVVTVSAPGLDEMFEEGINAVKKVACRPGREHTETNGKKLCRAFAGALSDTGRCRNIGRAAREVYLEKYTFSRWQADYLQLLFTL